MKKYCYIKGYPVDYDELSDDNHVYIHLLSDNEDYSLAVNTASNLRFSRLFYLKETYTQDEFFILTGLSEEMQDAIYRQRMEEPEIYLDYKEMGILNREREFLSARNKKDNNNRLHTLLREEIREVMAEPEDYIIAFGSEWGPKPYEEDWTFRFKPGHGLHDIHCNQKSPVKSPWFESDVTHHDGAIYFVHQKEHRVTGIYFVFNEL